VSTSTVVIPVPGLSAADCHVRAYTPRGNEFPVVGDAEDRLIFIPGKDALAFDRVSGRVFQVESPDETADIRRVGTGIRADVHPLKRGVPHPHEVALLRLQFPRTSAPLARTVGTVDWTAGAPIRAIPVAPQLLGRPESVPLDPLGPPALAMVVFARLRGHTLSGRRARTASSDHHTDQDYHNGQTFHDVPAFGEDKLIPLSDIRPQKEKSIPPDFQAGAGDLPNRKSPRHTGGTIAIRNR